MGNSSKVNKLNDLTPQDWLKFTKTWFIHYANKRKGGEKLHPAKYPENMVEEFVRFFTKSGQIVFDPFLGTGSTLVACHNSQRNGIGIELQQKYSDVAKKRLEELNDQEQLNDVGSKHNCRQLVLEGNSADVNKFWKKYSLPEIDLVITSPPYGPMLNKKLGLVIEDRKRQGLDLNYSADEEDLGNSEGYEEFLQRLVDIFLQIKPRVKIGGHLVVILQNYMHKGDYKMLAWDFAREMSKHFQLRGEKIWCQDNKPLYPYGYRYSFVPNVHHHYCLVFKRY
jgi:DNA modification methylase